MKKNIIQLVCSLWMLSMATIGAAQIVNVESARMQSDTTGLMGSVGAGFSISKSVRQISTIEVESHLQYKTKKNLWLLLGSYGFQRGGGENFENNSFVHFRFNTKLNAVIRWEFFTQLQNNLVTQIDSRFLLGTGPRFKICSSKVFRLYVAALFMYERERESTTPAVMHNDIRNSSYISFTLIPEKGIEIISTTYYQPLVKKISDYRVLNQAVLKVRPKKHFSLSMRWNYLHDRFPAGRAPSTTYSFSSGIGYEF